jgi:hypothetical protein
MGIFARPFTWKNGTMTTNGYAEIQQQGLAGGSGNELAINNILVWLALPGVADSVQRVQFKFGEYGGNLNLWINNQLQNIDNFSQLNGVTIGGVQVRVLSGGLGNDHGQLELIGKMKQQASGLGQLALGGQELWIDDICFAH